MGLFFNPNIHPLREYLKRRQAVAEAARALEIEVVYLDREYDLTTHMRRMVFREDQRCFLCYHLRLERTRNIALNGRFNYFTSTLLYSKRQKHQLISKAGESLSLEKCSFMYEDFRQGWNQGQEKAEAMGVYRQDYCGCIYSEFERNRADLERLIKQADK